MKPLSWRVWVLVIALLPGACDGCGSCGDPYLAELVKIEADVKRDHAGSVGEWGAGEEGDRFRIGDGLRTGKGATAMLAMLPSGHVQVQESTTIRFEKGGDDEVRRLDVESGEVEVETGAVDLEVMSPIGLTRVETGSKLTLATRDGRTQIAVVSGRAIIENDGQEREINEGESVDLVVGAALFEDPEPEPADAGGPDAAADAAQGEAAVSTVHDVGLVAGEVATIHDANAPTRVGIPTTRCENGGLVEVARGGGRFNHQSVKGNSVAVVTLARGGYRYRIRCLDADGEPSKRTKVRGSLKISTDSATRKLAAKAQRVTVDADGRKYRVHYSNRLPEMTFGWRDAPPADRYELLVHRPRGKVYRRRTKTPRLVLPSGKLGEGLHRFTWKAGKTGPVSKESSLEISFENTGRTAYVAGRLPAGSAPGKVRVVGGALAQSNVTVEGQRASMDSQGRFSLEVPVPDDGSAVSIRVTHPTTGVHYYIRRVH